MAEHLIGVLPDAGGWCWRISTNGTVLASSATTFPTAASARRDASTCGLKAWGHLGLPTDLFRVLT